MRTWGVVTFWAGAAICLARSPALAQSSADAVTALSPDERPALIVQLPEGALMLARQPSPSAAQRLASSLGLGTRPRQTLEPLPPPWRTAQPDRGLAGELRAALDHTQANWPWRELRLLEGAGQMDRELARNAGADVAISRISLELEDFGARVALLARAEITIVRALGTAREARSQVLLRHLGAPFSADSAHARRDSSPFRPGGALDESVRVAALDLTRLLAVTIERADAPGGLTAGSSRRVRDLPHTQSCSQCRPEDTVLHQEPGRIWIAPARSPNTILSRPLAAPKVERS